MRLLNFLNEREARDRLFRGEAQRIINNMKSYLKRFSKDELDDILNKKPNSKYKYVWTLDYTNIDKTYDLLIMFIPQKKEDFAIGSYKGTPTLVLPIVYQNNPETILINLDTSRISIKHELIHFLDKERGALALGKRKLYRNLKEYYNDPEEFNAYYQEGIDDVVKFLEDHGDKKRVLKLKNFDTAQGFIDKVKTEYLDDDFVNHLNNKYTRKLNKRLADLYQQLKDDNILKI